MGHQVHTLESYDEWKKYLNLAAESKKVVIVDFTAGWCGPCRIVKPYYQELSQEFTALLFLMVDVDALEEVAAECGVNAMPTFQVWHEGEKKEELVGASKDRLKALISKWSEISSQGKPAPALAAA